MRGRKTLDPYQEIAQLSWIILEAKFAYYCPADVRPEILQEISLTDSEYDAIESRYVELCGILEITPNLKVGFPISGSAALVVKKYGTSDAIRKWLG